MAWPPVDSPSLGLASNGKRASGTNTSTCRGFLWLPQSRCWKIMVYKIPWETLSEHERFGGTPNFRKPPCFFEVIVLRHDYALRTPFSVWQYLFSFMILAQNRCIHLQYTKVYLVWISLASASSDVFRSKFHGANLKTMWWSQCHRHSPKTGVIFSLWPLFWLGNGMVIGWSMALIPKKPGWWCNNHLEKYESQWEGWHPIYEMENNPAMFETTNQKQPAPDFFLHNFDLFHELPATGQVQDEELGVRKRKRYLATPLGSRTATMISASAWHSDESHQNHKSQLGSSEPRIIKCVYLKSEKWYFETYVFSAEKATAPYSSPGSSRQLTGDQSTQLSSSLQLLTKRNRTYLPIASN